VDAACFEQMRSRAADLAPEMDVEGFWKDPDRFFNRGETGQWRQFMDSEGEARYLERLALLAHPDVAEWVQRGWRSEPAPV
jgi:hypothetical protein